ncbi:MAG: MerR family transcriptional regulator [Gammaproteobacteria bacterium]|jgi:DNA-binding transcriptional MerR regulator
MTEASTDPSRAEEGGLYPIRTVASLTGVNPVTLRAWERRYQLIEPRRTNKGHRLYTRQDIERIQRVVQYLDQGISISQVKPLVDRPAEQGVDTATPEHGNDWQRYAARMLHAIEQFDERTLDVAYNEALSLYPVNLVLQKLVIPLLRTLGERWKERPGGVAEEHFFSVYLRNKLGARIHHLNARGTGPLLLLSCLPGEYHENGMLFFALAALSHGYRVLVLGSNLPLDQVPAVLEQKPCDAVILSGSARPARGLFNHDLPDLTRQLEVPVFVGGLVAGKFAEAIAEAGAIPVGHEFQPAFRLMHSILASTSRA